MNIITVEALKAAISRLPDPNTPPMTPYASVSVGGFNSNGTSFNVRFKRQKITSHWDGTEHYIWALELPA